MWVTALSFANQLLLKDPQTVAFAPCGGLASGALLSDAAGALKRQGEADLVFKAQLLPHGMWQGLMEPVRLPLIPVHCRG